MVCGTAGQRGGGEAAGSATSQSILGPTSEPRCRRDRADMSGRVRRLPATLPGMVQGISKNLLLKESLAQQLSFVASRSAERHGAGMLACAARGEGREALSRDQAGPRVPERDGTRALCPGTHAGRALLRASRSVWQMAAGLKGAARPHARRTAATRSRAHRSCEPGPVRLRQRARALGRPNSRNGTHPGCRAVRWQSGWCRVQMRRGTRVHVVARRRGFGHCSVAPPA